MDSMMGTKLASMRILGSAAGLALTIACLAAAQQPPPPGAPAERVYKNIQVLKGVPADQITPVMRVIARDLGITCEYCHDEMDRAKDGLEAKETARSMIVMMREINKNSFGGNTEVTCFTCHNGHNVPTNIPALPPFSVAYLGPGDEVKPPALPTVDQVLAKYVQALGGEQSLRKVTTMVITGTRQNYAPAAAAVPPPFPIEQYSKAPNLSLTVARPANGANSSGFDGTTAWTQNAQGRVTPLAGAAANRARRDADFYPALNMKQQYQQLTVTGIEKIGDRETYVVVAAAQGESPEWFYFDAQSGLLLRHQVILTSAVGNVPYATDYENYRDAGNGVKVPYAIHIVGPSRPDCANITVDKVQLNVAIDNSKFAKPASTTP
jgi:photosynthetic reaction center cytochrome c subunit